MWLVAVPVKTIFFAPLVIVAVKRYPEHANNKQKTPHTQKNEVWYDDKERVKRAKYNGDRSGTTACTTVVCPVTQPAKATGMASGSLQMYSVWAKTNKQGKHCHYTTSSFQHS